MPVNATIKTKHIVMGAVLVVLAVMVARQYLGMIRLPTMSRIEEETKSLQSRKMDLKVLEKQVTDWESELADMQTRAIPFWAVGARGGAIEQEVIKEINGMARAAKVTLSKVDTQRNKIAQYTGIQEVEIRLELKGTTMQEVARFLAEVDRSKRILYWSYCKIAPDNPRTPKGVNLSGRLKAYAMTQEASEFILGKQMTGTEAVAAAGTPTGAKGQRGATSASAAVKSSHGGLDTGKGKGGTP